MTKCHINILTFCHFLPYKIKYLPYFIYWHKFCICYSKQLKYNICMVYTYNSIIYIDKIIDNNR